jgi:hypothetical protein
MDHFPRCIGVAMTAYRVKSRVDCFDALAIVTVLQSRVPKVNLDPGPDQRRMIELTIAAPAPEERPIYRMRTSKGAPVPQESGEQGVR